MAKAIKSRPDLHFGVYFSQYEWYHPLYLQDKNNSFKTQYYVKVEATFNRLVYIILLWNSYRSKIQNGVQYNLVLNVYESKLYSKWAIALIRSTNVFLCVQEVSQPQLRELIMNYEPEVIYSDAEWDADYNYWNSTNFLAWLYNDR